MSIDIIQVAIEIEKTDKRKSIDYLFDQFNELYMDGRFEEANDHLAIQNYDDMSQQMLLNICCVMHWARESLQCRKDLLVKIRKLLTDKAPEEVDALMYGFESV